MQKSSKKFFWLALALFISNSLAHTDPPTLLSEPLKVLANDSKNITLEISSKDNYNNLIGDKGSFALITNYIDTEPYIFDISDIEELTTFNATFQVDDKYYNYNFSAKCRLWKPISKPINIICKLEKSLSNGTYYVKLEKNIKYKDYSIKIISTGSIRIELLNSPLPLLYSSQQTIVIEDGKEDYFFEFNIEEYNNELLLLMSQVFEVIALDECSQEGKDLKCIIRKTTLEKILANNNQTF